MVKTSRVPAEMLRSERLEAALDRAVASGDPAELLELLSRSSGLPGPRANLDLAKAMGIAMARHGGRADTLLRSFGRDEGEFPRIVAALAFGARSLSGVDPRGALAALQELAEDARHHVRAGVVAALRMRIGALGEEAVDELAAWTDGYLQASVAVQALADRDLLARLPTGAGVVARLDEAFALADGSPRAAERTQGVRTLRQDLPGQIAVIAARFPEALAWLEHAAAAKRPESRDVVAKAVSALRRGSMSDAESQRLLEKLAASAPVPRDAARIVQGTRKRSRGRS